MTNHPQGVDIRFSIVELFIKHIPDFPSLDAEEQLAVIDMYYNYITKGELPNDKEREQPSRSKAVNRGSRKPTVEVDSINIQDE